MILIHKLKEEKKKLINYPGAGGPLGNLQYPTRAQAVPSQDPSWDYDHAVKKWYCHHFQACALETLRRSKVKPLNYVKLATVLPTQNGSPMAFLERLRKALFKYMAISPDTPEAEMILNDKFVTQLPPDIQRKLKKLSIGLEGMLEVVL